MAREPCPGCKHLQLSIILGHSAFCRLHGLEIFNPKMAGCGHREEEQWKIGEKSEQGRFIISEWQSTIASR